MLPKEAFDAIQAAIAADAGKRMVDARYWPEVFGNFIVAFEEDGRPKSIVCDRFELVVCEDLQGERGCRTVLRSVRETEPSEVLKTLGL